MVAGAPPPAGTLTAAAPSSRAASRAPTAARRQRRITRRPTYHHEPTRYRDGRRSRSRPTPAAPPNKEGGLRPPEEGPARDDDGRIDHLRSRSTPAACPERRPRAPTRPPDRPANWSTASGASGARHRAAEAETDMTKAMLVQARMSPQKVGVGLKMQKAMLLKQMALLDDRCNHLIRSRQENKR